MQSTLELLRTVSVFLAGMLGRIALFLAMTAVLVLPALALAALVRGAAARRQRALGIRELDGMPFRPDVLHAPGHVWLRPRPGRTAFELGIDGLAQRLVPAVTAVDLAHPGMRVRRGDAVATLHGGGRTIAVAAPADGTVAGVNAAVARDPALVTREGYGRGWLVVLALADDGAASLPTGEDAEAWMRGEAARYARFLEERLGFAAADGGALVAPAPWLVSDDDWKALAAAFLRP
jgi:glycine cleavage system H protein